MKATQKLLFQDGNLQQIIISGSRQHDTQPPVILTIAICSGGRAVCFHGNAVPLLPLRYGLLLCVPHAVLYNCNLTVGCWCCLHDRNKGASWQVSCFRILDGPDVMCERNIFMFLQRRKKECLGFALLWRLSVPFPQAREGDLAN